MLLTILGLTLLASTPQVPPVSCQYVNGKRACGYSCQSSVDEVRFDPPLAAIHHPPDEGLRPECKGIGDEAACGFNCLVAKGKVACARTPYGECREHLGELKCWDPPESVIHELGAETPPLACLTASTAIECGYDCEASRAEVRCAATPRGRCEKDDFRLECFDPPSLTHCAHAQPPDPAEVRKPKHKRKEAQAAQAERPTR